MDQRKVQRLRRELDSLRNRKRSVRASDLVSLAARVGRKKVKRGKEPTYEKPGSFPLTIPGHAGTLAIGTAVSILDQLEEDIDRLERESKDEEGGADEEEDDEGE